MSAVKYEKNAWYIIITGDVEEKRGQFNST
jgi:hypothetical protein